MYNSLIPLQFTSNYDISFSAKDKLKARESEDETHFFKAMRIISADIVGKGGWNCSYFSEEVLLEAIPLFANAVLKFDHHHSAKEAIGNVVDPFFSQKIGSVPSGIDGLIRIKRVQSHLDLIQLLSDTPSPYQAISAGLQVEWEPSHTFEDEWQFWNLIGEQINGEYVCIVVTKIVAVNEVSIVDVAADPNAKLYDEEYLNNVLKSVGFSDQKRRKELVFSMKEKKGIKTVEPNTTDEDNPNEMLHLSEQVASLSQDLLNANIELNKSKAQANSIKIELESTKAQLAQKDEELIGVQALAEENIKLLDEAKKAKTQYAFDLFLKANALRGEVGEAEKKSMQVLLSKANDSELAVLVETWGGKLMSDFPEPTCANCGSTTLVFKKSAPTEENNNSSKGENNLGAVADSFYD